MSLTDIAIQALSIALLESKLENAERAHANATGDALYGAFGRVLVARADLRAFNGEQQ